MSKTLTFEVTQDAAPPDQLVHISKRPHAQGSNHASEVRFASIEAVRNVLTRERLALLRAIKGRRPGSIYELAKVVERNLKSVQTDLKFLQEHGLVRLNVHQQARRKQHVKVPEAPFGEIAVRIAI